MRIAIDLRPLQIGHENRGIGAYLINILSRTPSAKDWHFIFYQYSTSNPLDDHHIAKPPSYEIIKIPQPVWRRSIIDLIRYIKAGLYPAFPKLGTSHPDVFLQSDFQLGLPKIRHCQNYVVMYDLIPLILPEYYLPNWQTALKEKDLSWRSRLTAAAKLWYHRKRYLKNLKKTGRANKILSISQSTSSDLHKYLGLDKGKITTIPLAASFRSSQDQKRIRPAIKTQIAKIKRPYLTYIGGTDVRRRIAELVEAFDQLNSQGLEIDLVLAGNELARVELIPNIEGRNAILASPYKRQIHLLGFISDAEKQYVLQQAAVFVYPTLYEGFGLPILEAMQAGCPVVAYNNSSIPEIAGNAIAYAPTPDAGGIKLAVEQILHNPARTKKMVKAGQQRASKYDWEKTAQKTWQTILDAD